MDYRFVFFVPHKFDFSCFVKLSVSSSQKFLDGNDDIVVHITD
jgi:hypothetical protein